MVWGDKTQCVLCRDRDAQARGLTNTDATMFECSQCGRFSVDGTVSALGGIFSDAGVARRRHLLRAHVRNSSTPIFIDQNLLNAVKDGKIREKTVTEKIELAMGWFERQSPKVGTKVDVNMQASDFLVAWCHDVEEWRGLIDLIVGGPKLLEYEFPQLKNASAVSTKITFEGWKWLSKRPRSASNIGFIAMWFDTTLDPVKAAVEEGISDAGYSPLRIDDDHFAGGVMDRIIARVRESRFVVADFTGNRGGVYYEAGFAAGLGLPVFCLCQEAQTDPTNKDRIHFDVAHLKMISWKEGDLTRLTERLRDAICAELGRGPLSQ
jgi:nucleoside 2-deoxyribosyltransferase